MQVQIVFNKEPVFSLDKKNEDDTPSWFDFQVLCILMAIAQAKNNRVIETTKKDICQKWGKTVQGKNYKWIGKALDSWSDILSHEKKGKKIEISIEEEFFKESIRRGQIWDLERVLSMNGVVFRMTQIFSCGLYHKETLRYHPKSLCKMIPLQADKEYIARKKIISRLEDVFYELKKRGLDNCSYTRAREKGKILIYVSNKNPYLQIKDPPIKKGPVQFGELEAVQCGASENFISDVYTEKEKVTCQNQPLSTQNSTTEYEKSQGEFDQACSFYESISRDFDRRSLSSYADSVAINWNWHKEAIKFCANGQLATRQYSGKKIVGWYKSGSLKNEFQSYVDEQHKILAKKRREEQTPELKEEMFETMLSLLKSSTEEGKQELADSICEYRDTTDIYTAENRFREQAILKCLESPKMKKYNKPGYDELINTLFRWDEFGKHMDKNLKKSWYPEFNLKHKIDRGNNKPKLVEEVPEWKKKENAKFRLLQAAERRIKEAAQ